MMLETLPLEYTWAFDLDGTLCNYGEMVNKDVANILSTLGTVHIITGGPIESAEEQTQLITDKVIHGMRSIPGNTSIDLSKVLQVNKSAFCSSPYFQEIRRRLLMELRRVLKSEDIFVGGRSTIDIMLSGHKGHIISSLPGKVIYFYDCQWDVHEDICNDVPALTTAWKAVKTNYDRICEDIKTWQKKLS